MAEVTVKQFAEVVGISIDRLMEQLQEAGVKIANPDATITDDEKTFHKFRHAEATQLKQATSDKE